MAEMKQGVNRDERQPPGLNNTAINASNLRLSNVDFDEMNFEQRRAPYNSGNKTLSEKEADQRGSTSGNGRKRTGN